MEYNIFQPISLYKSPDSYVWKGWLGINTQYPKTTLIFSHTFKTFDESTFFKKIVFFDTKSYFFNFKICFFITAHILFWIDEQKREIKIVKSFDNYIHPKEKVAYDDPSTIFDIHSFITPYTLSVVKKFKSMIHSNGYPLMIV